MNAKTYILKLADRPVLIGDEFPGSPVGDEVQTFHHPRAVERFLSEHPGLAVEEIVATTDHVEDVDGVQVGPYGCCCDGCAADHAAEAAAEIAAGC